MTFAATVTILVTYPPAPPRAPCPTPRACDSVPQSPPHIFGGELRDLTYPSDTLTANVELGR